VVDVAPVVLPKTLRPRAERWLRAFGKLRAWELSQFERVVFIDSDAVVLHSSADELFDLAGGRDTLWTASDPRIDTCDQTHLVADPALNSGVLVFRPSLANAKNIWATIAAMAAEARTDFNDQDVLAQVFQHWRALPYPEYGGHVVHCGCPGFTESVRIAHFTAGLGVLPKPWTTTTSNSLGPTYNTSTCMWALFKAWKRLQDS
jgi:lipopolysaccharide biosynthesis glycosyltransferase